MRRLYVCVFKKDVDTHPHVHLVCVQLYNGHTCNYQVIRYFFRLTLTRIWYTETIPCTNFSKLLPMPKSTNFRKFTSSIHNCYSLFFSMIGCGYKKCLWFRWYRFWHMCAKQSKIKAEIFGRNMLLKPILNQSDGESDAFTQWSYFGNVKLRVLCRYVKLIEISMVLHLRILWAFLLPHSLTPCGKYVRMCSTWKSPKIHYYIIIIDIIVIIIFFYYSGWNEAREIHGNGRE